MAERPDLGNVFLNLQGAIDATKGKNKALIDDLERSADERQKALQDAERQGEQDLARELERGKGRKAVRTEGVRAAEEEQAAVQQTSRAVAADTAATNANAAAHRANAAARREAAAAAQAEAAAVREAQASAGRIPGAFAGASTPSLRSRGYVYGGERAAIDPTVYGSLRRQEAPFLTEKYQQPSEADTLKFWQESLGREAPGEPIPGPLLTGGTAARQIETSDPKTFSKYAKAAGWTKEAQKARRLEAKEALAEAKAAQEEEKKLAEAAAVPSAPARKVLTAAEAGIGPEELYAQDLIEGRRRGLGTAALDLSPAVGAVGARPAATEQAAAAKAAKAEEVAATKAANAAMLADQKAYQTAALAEARLYEGARKEAAAEAGRQALGLSPAAGGAGGGGRLPPTAVAAGGAAGGGGGEEGRIKAVTAAKAEEVSIERELAAAAAASAAMTERSAGAYANASTALTRHGALTAEFIQALIRGEVTLKEFETQLGLTIGKFAGWAVAGGLVYGAYEAIKKLFDGVTNTQSGVEQLRRSLGEAVNVPEAEQGFRKLAREVNVPIPEVAEAQFFSARVFHDQAQSLELASVALRAYKLDQVSVQDAVKGFGSVAVAFKVGPDALRTTFDQLDVGQLKFNARLSQTLPQMGRAAASWAAAGGSLKGLGDTLIEINRATGGGGGTGGGNPATALLREPANLTRPESEQTLRRYGIDPVFAREHIDQFNKEIQRRAKLGDLKETDLQELAKAAGGGAGVGFRYLLPLFRIGKTPLPEEVEGATAEARGSAEEDLRHKLAQTDEQIKRLGVDFEIFGSQAGGQGVQRVLTDFLTALNKVILVAAGAVDPFAKLASALSQLPGIIRIPAEAALAYAGISRLSRTRVGESVGRLAGESPFILKAAADPALAGQIRSVLVSQRAREGVLQNELQRVTLAGQTALPAASLTARTGLARIEARGARGTTEEEIAEYDAEIAAAKARVRAGVRAEEENVDRQVALEAQIAETQAAINVLAKRRFSAEEKRAVIAEKEAFGPAAGLGGLGGLISPNQRRAEEEAARKRGVPIAAGGAGPQVAETAPTVVPVGEGATAVGRAAEQETAAAEQTAAAAGGASALLGRAGATTKEAAGKVAGLGSGLINFVKNLGLLGKAFIVYAALDIAGQLDGIHQDVEKASSAIGTLERPQSQAQLEQQIEASRQSGIGGVGFGERLKGALSFPEELISHPQQGIEELANRFGNVVGLDIGAPHPANFALSRLEQASQLAREKQKELAEGKVPFPGAGGGEAARLRYQEIEEENLEGLTSTDEKRQQTSKAKAQAELKLRLQQLEAFHGRAAQENIGFITSQIGVYAGGYVATGSQTAFEQYTEVAKAGLAGINNVTKERGLVLAKLARTPQALDKVIKEGEAETNATLAGIARNIAERRNQVQATRAEGLTTDLSTLEERQSVFGPPLGQVIPGAPQITPLTPLIGPPTKQSAAQAALEKRNKEQDETEEYQKRGIEEARAERNKALFEASFEPRRAEEQLATAGLGKLAKAEGNLKLALEKQKEEVKALGKDKLNLPALAAAQNEVVQAVEEVAQAHAAKYERQTQLAIAQLPAGTSAAARLGLEASRAAGQLKFVEGLKAPAGLKTELIEQAQIANANAIKAQAENSLQESKQVSQLNTQIAVANAEGDAEAVAAAEAAGAAKEAAEAKTEPERLQAVLSAIKASHDAEKAVLDKITVAGELAEAREPNDLEKAKEKLRTLRRLFPKEKKDEKEKNEVQQENQKRTIKQLARQEEESILEDRFKLHEIGPADLAAGWQKILEKAKKEHASARELREIQDKAYEALHQGLNDLIVGNIQLPTYYGARTLTAKAQGAAGLPANYGYTGAPLEANTINNNVQIDVHDAHNPEVTAKHVYNQFRHATKGHRRTAGLVR